MAFLGNPPKKFIFILIFIVLGIGDNRYARATTVENMNGLNNVDGCPQNKSEWQDASKRLNCSNDPKNPLNRYHCLPVNDLSTLVEFCYNGTRPQVTKGLCMKFVQEINILDSYNCTAFENGCPDMFYLSDESFEYPRCMDIDPVGHCYVAESSCTLTSTTSNDITSITETVPTHFSPKNRDNKVAIYLSLNVGIPVLTCIVVTIICIRRKKLSKQEDKIQKEKEPLLPEPFVSEIKRQGIDYLLQELPNDIKSKLEIAKILKVPPEVLSWNMDNRQQFVTSMKKGSISVYSGRGIVIGCAETGNDNLVQKLKRGKYLSPGPTRGTEIHTNEFQLDAKESTIIVANDNEEEDKYSGNEPSPNASDQIQLEHIQTDEHPIAMQTNLDIETSIRRPSVKVLKDNDNKTLQRFIDTICCVSSKKNNNFKRLSLLDFSGQSACHPIIFNSRAFYILLIDISKDLESVIDERFYRDWTYADYISYWLGSIHTFSSISAPVILVASDSGSTEAEKVKKDHPLYFEEICHALPQNFVKHLDKARAFSFEKNSDKNMKDLKKRIVSTLKSQDHWGRNIPIAWTKIESLLKIKRKSIKMCNISSLLEDLRIEDDQHLTNDEELLTALLFFHDTGVILYQKEIGEIIIDVQWFLDAFKCILVNDTHNRTQLDELGLPMDCEELNGYGLLSSRCLGSLWNNSNLSFHGHQAQLIKHMVNLDMIAELNPDLWCVPCMNKRQYYKSILENCTVSSTLCFVFKFLPMDIFHCLVASCINKLNMTLWRSRGEYCIYHNVAVLRCENTTQKLLIGIRGGKGNVDGEYSNSIEIQAIKTKDHAGTLDSQLCSGIKQKIYEILSNLTKTFQTDEKPFQLGYRCQRTPYDDLPEGHIILENDISTDGSVECSKCNPTHNVEVDNIIGHWKPTEHRQSTEADSGFYQRVPEPTKEYSQMAGSNAYGMEQIHKDALRLTRVSLVTNLDVNIISDELLSRDIFTPLMMEFIMNERTRIDRVRRLLDDIVRRGSNAYHGFLEALRKSGYEYLANEIVRNEELRRRENATN